MVALSVSISASTSPGLILSPTFFSQRARLPFSMVGESAGMRMSIGMARLRYWASQVEHRFRRRENCARIWQSKRFEVRGIRHRHILAANPYHGRIEVI